MMTSDDGMEQVSTNADRNSSFTPFLQQPCSMGAQRLAHFPDVDTIRGQTVAEKPAGNHSSCARNPREQRQGQKNSSQDRD